MINTAAAIQYKVFSLDYLKAYIVTMRPYLMFVSGITGIAGMSFALNDDTNKYLLIFSASFLSYGFGQALTDCFQTDTDSISSPYRPLTQNLVSKNAFMTTSIIGLIFCVSILSVYNPLNILIGSAGGIGLATYTFFKRKWWGGPFYNAWIVTALFLMGFFAASNGEIPLLIIPAALSVLFGYANFVLSGYFKDIEADKATGYNTLPVVYGRKVAAIISDIFSAIFVLLVLTIISANIFNTSGLIFFTAGTAAAIYAQIKLHKVKNDIEAHKAIAPVVHSYLLILSSIILFNKPEWLVPVIGFFALYLIVLNIRPSKDQI